MTAEEELHEYRKLGSIPDVRAVLDAFRGLCNCTSGVFQKGGAY